MLLISLPQLSQCYHHFSFLGINSLNSDVVPGSTSVSNLFLISGLGDHSRSADSTIKKEQSRNPMVLVALAVCDTLVILTSLWLELDIDYNLLKAYNGLPIYDDFNIGFFHNYYFQWSSIFSDVIYKMAATASLYLTVIITLERYICICHPFWFEEWCTYSRICKAVAATIVLSIAYHMSKFWDTQVLEQFYIHDGKIDTFYVPYSSKMYDYYSVRSYIYTWMFITVDYILPLTCIVVLNTITFIKLRIMTRNRREISNEQRNEDKLTAMILYVVLEFMVCTSASGFMRNNFWVTVLHDKKGTGFGYWMGFRKVGSHWISIGPSSLSKRLRVGHFLIVRAKCISYLEAG
ncbi:hypothetical protein GE061_012344 [Apolygus lucorum]|uniref:G-protein coupled receptors family 1 profile domain-containing protein n=1 Tax=Apolygus lucorum TaxID=248454 RepID=A0A8S9XTE3_APOLU|nr:hypothetical protein GE061_012344 [Apolygus lucorum]